MDENRRAELKGAGTWRPTKLPTVKTFIMARRGIDSGRMKPVAAAWRALSMMKSLCSG